jgi:hypothetical protein
MSRSLVRIRQKAQKKIIMAVNASATGLTYAPGYGNTGMNISTQSTWIAGADSTWAGGYTVGTTKGNSGSSSGPTYLNTTKCITQYPEKKTIGSISHLLTYISPILTANSDSTANIYLKTTSAINAPWSGQIGSAWGIGAITILPAYSEFIGTVHVECSGSNSDYNTISLCGFLYPNSGSVTNALTPILRKIYAFRNVAGGTMFYGISNT